jgi:hypothetical protein
LVEEKVQTLIARQPKARFVLIAFAGLSLLTGLWAGSIRLGWNLPVGTSVLPLIHGPLMVVGFLGTLIGLERAVAMGRLWPYGVPLFAALGILSVLAGLPIELGATLAVFASSIMVFVFGVLYRQAPAAHFVTMSFSSAAWLAGNCLWLAGLPLYTVVPWWVGFLVLMIAGERLELSRVMRPGLGTRALFHACTAVIIAGLVYSMFDFYIGIRLAGMGWSAQALWLMRHDIAWRTVHQPGLPRFMAISLLIGYFWLAIGGLLWFALAHQFTAGPRYDAMLHSIFLGFVFSMIFAHAPVIFPSITAIALPFHRIFYVHLILLHASLLLRIGGDLSLSLTAQRWGGLLNVAAILLFLVNNVSAAKRGAASLPRKR